MANLIEHRCTNTKCNKIVCKATEGDVMIEILCSKCKRYNVIKCNATITKRYDESGEKMVDSVTIK